MHTSCGPFHPVKGLSFRHISLMFNQFGKRFWGIYSRDDGTRFLQFFKRRDGLQRRQNQLTGGRPDMAGSLLRRARRPAQIGNPSRLMFDPTAWFILRPDTLAELSPRPSVF